MLTPSTITIAQGATGTVAVATTLVAGANQLVKFEVQGLPPRVPLLPPFSFSQAAQFTLNPSPGVKVQFSPNPARVGVAVQLDLTVFNVPPGTYPLTVVATGDANPTIPVNAALTLVVTPSTFTV